MNTTQEEKWSDGANTENGMSEHMRKNKTGKEGGKN